MKIMRIMNAAVFVITTDLINTKNFQRSISKKNEFKRM